MVRNIYLIPAAWAQTRLQRCVSGQCLLFGRLLPVAEGTDVGSVLKDVVIDFYLLASPEIL